MTWFMICSELNHVTTDPTTVICLFPQPAPSDLLASMKILSLSLFTFPSAASPQPTMLSSAADLSDYSFLTRGTVQEGLVFLSSTVAGRTTDGQRVGVEEGGNVCSVYRKGTVAGPYSSFDARYEVLAH